MHTAESEVLLNIKQKQAVEKFADLLVSAGDKNLETINALIVGTKIGILLQGQVESESA